MKAHQRPEEQSIFPIVQGGVDPKLRTESAKQLIQRNVNGYAIGGLRYLCTMYILVIIIILQKYSVEYNGIYFIKMMKNYI